MSKKSQESGATPDKAKVRIFFAEVEGNNESVKEAVKAMVLAINRPPVAVTTHRSAADGRATGLPSPSSDSLEEEIELVDEQEAEQEIQELVPVPPRKRGTGPKRDYNAGIELVPDLDFRPEGKQTLREFFAEKSPKGDMEQVLVVTYYMQHYMGMAAIGFGHIRTGLKDVSKPVPADLRSTVRNMKKQKAWLSWSAPDAIQVTTIGENYVEHDIATRKA